MLSSICFPAFPRLSFFFFNETATTEIYTLSLHDALPISTSASWCFVERATTAATGWWWRGNCLPRSEEHTSELQSRLHLVCRLLLEKKKKNIFLIALALYVAKIMIEEGHADMLSSDCLTS